MSTKRDNERLRMDNERLTEKLQEAQVLAEVQLRNVGRLAAKAARTDDAEAALMRVHRDRDDAFRQIAVLERQVTNRDAENAKLAGELNAALAVIEAAGAADAWKPRLVR